MKPTQSEQYQTMATAIAKLYVGASSYELCDLVQEANLALVEALRTVNSRAEKPLALKAYIRLCIHNHLRDYVQNTSFDGGMISLDEEIGVDDEGDPLTRLDLLGVEPVQEEAVEKAEKRRSQQSVASNRIQAVEQRAREKGGVSRIQEIVKLTGEGLTHAEIGKKLGVTRQAITKSLSKIRKRKAA